MNTLLSSTCCQMMRRLNLSSSCIYKVPPFIRQKAGFSTTPVFRIQPRVVGVPESTQQALRKMYGLSNDYFVIYKEPKQELKAVVYAKCFELFLWASPLWGLCYAYFYETPLATFVGQDNFYVGAGIVFIYLLGIRFFVNGFVKVMFHNRSTDTYRAYVLHKFKPTYTYVDFTVNDLKVINLPPNFPMARNLFRAGKRNLVLHDQLFASYNDQEKLTGEAIERWHANWKK